jgi:hypothetical protein
MNIIRFVSFSVLMIRILIVSHHFLNFFVSHYPYLIYSPAYNVFHVPESPMSCF